MTIPAGKIAILDSVGGAMRQWRAQLQFNLVFGFFASLAIICGVFLVSALTLAGPSAVLLGATLLSMLAAYIYTGYLTGEASWASAWPVQGLRVWATLAIVGLFLFLMLLMLSVVASVIMAGAMGGQDIAAAKTWAAQEALVENYLKTQPWLMPGMLIVFGFLMVFVTSRFYVAAPGTVDARRLLSLETWAWTKGNTWRIAAARFMLLLPCAVFAFAVPRLAVFAFGFNPFSSNWQNAFVQANPLGLFVVLQLSLWLSLSLSWALDAALSTQIYKGLKPTA